MPQAMRMVEFRNEIGNGRSVEAENNLRLDFGPRKPTRS